MKIFSIVVLCLLMLTAVASAQTLTLPPATASGQSMSWANTCSGISCGFNIYRIPGACSATPAGSSGWTLLTIAPITATTFNDSTAVAGTLYCYGIEAVNGTANSAPLVGATTVPTRPTTPTGLSFF